MHGHMNVKFEVQYICGLRRPRGTLLVLSDSCMSIKTFISSSVRPSVFTPTGLTAGPLKGLFFLKKSEVGEFH